MNGKLPELLDELYAMARLKKGPESLRILHCQANDTAAANETRALGNIIGTPGANDYLPQYTSNQTFRVNSSSADDNASGTGARRFKVVGVDEEFNEVSAEVAPIGLGLSALSVQMIHPNAVEMIDVGTDWQPAGQVKIQDASTNEVVRCPGGGVVSTMMKYICPKDHTAFVLYLNISAGSDVAGSADEDQASLADVFIFDPLDGTPGSWVRHQKIARSFSNKHRDDGLDSTNGSYEVMLSEGQMLSGRLINRTDQQVRYYSNWEILQVPNSLL